MRQSCTLRGQNKVRNDSQMIVLQVLTYFFPPSWKREFTPSDPKVRESVGSDSRSRSATCLLYQFIYLIGTELLRLKTKSLLIYRKCCQAFLREITCTVSTVLGDFNEQLEANAQGYTGRWTICSSLYSTVLVCSY